MPIQKIHKGFTLLEVLIAMVITVAATSIVLTHLRTLMDFNLRLKSHQHKITTLLNATAIFSSKGFDGLKTDIKKDFLNLYDFKTNQLVAQVKNYSENNQPVPPIDQAYTPYQIFIIQPELSYNLVLLLPGLNRPANK